MSPSTQDSRYQRMLDKHDEDLYRGDGPGRAAGIVSRINQLEEELIGMEKAVKGIERKFWAIVLMLLTMLGGIAVDIAKGH